MMQKSELYGGAVERSCFGTSNKLLGGVEAIGEIKERYFCFVAFLDLVTGLLLF